MPVPHAVIDINDSMATCDYDRRAAGNDDVNVTSRLTLVTNASSQSTSDDELSDQVILQSFGVLFSVSVIFVLIYFLVLVLVFQLFFRFSFVLVFIIFSF